MGFSEAFAAGRATVELMKILTQPEKTETDAGRRRQSDERLGRNLSNRVRIEMEDGEEEMSVLSDHNVEVDRQALERRRDQAVDDYIRRTSTPASGIERKSKLEKENYLMRRWKWIPGMRSRLS